MNCLSFSLQDSTEAGSQPGEEDRRLEVESWMKKNIFPRCLPYFKKHVTWLPVNSTTLHLGSTLL